MLTSRRGGGRRGKRTMCSDRATLSEQFRHSTVVGVTETMMPGLKDGCLGCKEHMGGGDLTTRYRMQVASGKGARQDASPIRRGVPTGGIHTMRHTFHGSHQGRHGDQVDGALGINRTLSRVTWMPLATTRRTEPTPIA
jgi:hypothetical protein